MTSVTTRPSARAGQGPDPDPDSDPGQSSGGSAPARSASALASSSKPIEWAHECDPGSPAADAILDSSEARRSSRLIGLDAARGLALIGMFAVHTISAETPDGDLSFAWALSSGKASALFAILGGVGMAFMTGRTRPPSTASGWARAAVTPLVRGLLILAIGLALGALVWIEDAGVILPYLGVMFALSALLIPLRAPALIGLGLGMAVVTPILSYVLRQTYTVDPSANLTLGSLLSSPGDSLVILLLTGYFPVLTWMSYIVLGMGIGRCDLSTRRVVAWLIAGGATLTILTAMATQALVAAGIRDRIAGQVRGHMTLETFTEHLVWGGDGSLPTDSAWWLGINAPHTGTPLDLLYTSGIAMTVIGVMLALSLAIGPLLHVLAAPGSMTLTLYSAHLLLLAPLRELPDLLHFAIQVGVLTLFALAWSSRFSRGPLEWVVWRVTKLVAPARRPERAGRGLPLLRPSSRQGRHRAPAR